MGGENGNVFFYTNTKTELNSQLGRNRIISSSFVSGGARGHDNPLTQPKVSVLPKNIIYARLIDNQRLLQVEEGSNNFMMKSALSKQNLVEHQGFKEQPYNFEQYRSFRYAKEDQFPLWRKGKQSMVLLDPKNYRVDWEFKEFWPKGMIPMKVCVAQNFNRIYGYSFDNNTGIFTIMNVNKKNKSIQNKSIQIPLSQKWVGLEMTTHGDTLIVSNACKNPASKNRPAQSYLKMMAVDLRSMKINIIAQQDFFGSSFQSAQLSRKIKGYDIFCVCAGANVNIIAYQEKKFHLLQTIPNVYKDRIIDLAIYRNFLIPIIMKPGETVKVIEFDAESYNSMIKQSEQKVSRVGLTKMQMRADMYVDQKIKRIDLPSMSGKKRIDVSVSGKTIFFGGRGGLNVLRRESSSQDFMLQSSHPPSSKCRENNLFRNQLLWIQGHTIRLYSDAGTRHQQFDYS